MKKLIALCIALAAAQVRAVLPSESSYVEFGIPRPPGTTQFTFTFKTTSTSHVRVLLDGVQQGTGYTVALNANQNSSPGGTVTFLVAPDLQVVHIERQVPVTQSCTFSPLSALRASTLEGCFDSIVMQTQQINNDHCKVGETCSATSFVASAETGTNAFAVGANGARIDFGTGANDYASSDGTTVTFAGPTASDSSFSAPTIMADAFYGPISGSVFGSGTSSAASGSNGLSLTQNGARIDFGSGANDYATSDGTTVTFAAPVSTGAITAPGLTLQDITPSLAITGQTSATLRWNITGGASIDGDIGAQSCSLYGYGPTGSQWYLDSDDSVVGGMSLLRLDTQVGGHSMVIEQTGALSQISPATTLVIAGGLQVSSNGTPISGSHRGTLTVDLASIAAGACAADQEITVTGAVTGAECIKGFPSTIPASLIGDCYVSAANTAQLRVCNNSAGAVDPPSLTYSVRTFNP